jgi:hypothetical protein
MPAPAKSASFKESASGSTTKPTYPANLRSFSVDMVPTPGDLGAVSVPATPATFASSWSAAVPPAQLAKEGFGETITTKLSLALPVVQGWLLLEMSARRYSDANAGSLAAAMLAARTRSTSDAQVSALADNKAVLSQQSTPKKVEKYFALYENADGEGPTLFWYATEEVNM